MTKQLGYEVDEHSGELLDAEGACNECRDGQQGLLGRRYGVGHYLCGGCDDKLLSAETRGEAGCMFTGNPSRWAWFWYGD